MKKDNLKKVIQKSRHESGGIDALFTPTNIASTVALSAKKIKTLTIEESIHSKIRQIAANDGVKLSEIVYDAFEMYFKYRNIK